MNTPPDPEIDFATLTTVFAAMAIRSGDVLELDQIADMAPADRAMFAARIVSRAAQADPVIASVLMKYGSVDTMRNEVIRRRKDVPA